MDAARTFTPEEVERIVALLDDERLRALRRASDRGILLQKDLGHLPLPSGLDVQSTGRILAAIRRQTASTLPWDSYIDVGHATRPWYSISRAMMLLLEQFNSRSCSGSALDRALKRLSGSHAVVRLLVVDLCDALKIEGFEADPERTHALFSGQIAPESVLDRVIVNYALALAKVEPLAKKPIDPGLVEHLRYLLLDGVDDPGPSAKIRPYRPYSESVYHDSRAALEKICEIAESPLSEDPLYHPLLRMISMAWLFLDFEPVPNLNAVIFTLVRHIYLLRSGFSAFRWAPIMETWLASREDRLVGLRARKDVYEDAMVDWGYGLDSTNLFLMYLTSFLDNLRKVEDTVERASRSSLKVETLLEGKIGSRQMSIILNFARNPYAAQKIEPHRRFCGVAYGTARADYLDLEKRGYLIRKQEGRAFVFYPSPSLLALFERLMPGESSSGPLGE